MRRPVLAVLLVALLCPMLSPALVSADSESSGQGQFSIGNVAPSIQQIKLYQSDENTIVDGSGNSMTPQQEYALKIVASDGNGYGDITQITVYIYYATDVSTNPTGTFDTQQEAIFTWDPSNGWQLSSGGATTTWTVEANSRGPIDVTTIQGTWWLHFKPGKVAKEADGTTAFWIIDVKVQDSGGYTDEKKNNVEEGGSVLQYSMQWYGETAIASSDLPFDFGAVDLGSSNNPMVTPSEGYIDVYVVANGDYNLKVKATDSTGANSYWVGQNHGDHATLTTDSPGDGQIRLKANTANDASSAVAFASTYVALLTGQTGPTDDGSAANGDGTDINVYMWLDVGSSGLIADTYQGLVWFMVENG
ncbi:MAG: hypothetical protein QI223_04645 [Candidatus Korarchaeota archaeon]|nr:hypothetical protein [Candidatus Korarchaeota archaeon]